MCDLWQDEKEIIQSEEVTAEEMSSYESKDNQGQVSNKISTLKISIGNSMISCDIWHEYHE